MWWQWHQLFARRCANVASVDGDGSGVLAMLARASSSVEATAAKLRRRLGKLEQQLGVVMTQRRRQLMMMNHHHYQ